MAECKRCDSASRRATRSLEFFIAAWPDVFGKAEAVTVTARKIAVLFYKYTSSRPACARAPMDAVLRA